MEKHVIRIATIVGLVAAFAAPAHAEHSNLEVAVRLGPAYVQYSEAYGRYDRYRHYDHYRKHWRKHKKRHKKHHYRQLRAHERWHWHNDHRWDRYYDYDHWRFHHELGYWHRDFHRKGRRHH